MDTIEKATVLRYHQDRLGGTSFHALGWKDLESQQKRFDALCRMGDLNGHSVMDMGCGTGDLKYYLDLHYREVTYLGIDQVPEFIEEAKRKFQHIKNAFFFQGDFTTDGFPQVDYVLASGALSYHSKNLLFPYTMILKMYNAAKYGIAFNLLDKEGFNSTGLLKAHDRYEILSYCKLISKTAELITDYLPDDFTIVMHK